MESKSLILGSLLLVLAAAFITGCCDQSGSMEDENKAVVMLITTEGVNMHNPDKWDDVLTPDYVRHCQAMPPNMQEIHGINSMKNFLADHFTAFPDWNEQVDFILADGNKVAYVTTGTGTQTGPMGQYAPTGKSVNIKTFVIHRFEDGKIAESWVSWDNVAFLSQLGLFTPVPATAAPSEEKQIKVDTPIKKGGKGKTN
jgi:predicted ester cyclase